MQCNAVSCHTQRSIYAITYMLTCTHTHIHTCTHTNTHTHTQQVPPVPAFLAPLPPSILPLNTETLCGSPPSPNPKPPPSSSNQRLIVTAAAAYPCPPTLLLTQPHCLQAWYQKALLQRCLQPASSQASNITHTLQALHLPPLALPRPVAPCSDSQANAPPQQHLHPAAWHLHHLQLLPRTQPQQRKRQNPAQSRSRCSNRSATTDLPPSVTAWGVRAPQTGMQRATTGCRL